MAKVRLGDGRVLNFKGTPTQADIEEAVRMLGTQSQETEQPRQGIVGGLVSSFKERGERVLGELRRATSGEEPAPLAGGRLGLRTAGEIAGGAGDVLGAAFSAGGRALSAVTPDFIEDPIVNKVRDGIQSLVESDTVQGGIEGWKAFKKENPELARDVESVTNIALLTTLRPKAKGVLSEQVKRAKNATQTRLEKQLLDEAVSVVKQPLDKRGRVSSLSAGAGRQTGIGPLSGIKSTPSPKDIQIGRTVTGLVSAKSNPVKNIKNIREAIVKTSDQVDEGLRNNNTIFNNKQLRTALNGTKEESRVVFGTEKTLENNYDAVINEFMRITGKHKNNLEGLRKARIEFDKVVEKKFPKIFDNPYSDVVRTNAITDVRTAANDYIASLLPQGNKFKQQLLDQSNMYKGIKNIAMKAEGIVDKGIGDRVITLLRNNVVAHGLTGGIITIGALGALLTNPILIGAAILGGSVKIGKTVITSKALKKLMIKSLKLMDDGTVAGTPVEKAAVLDLLHRIDQFTPAESEAEEE